MEDKEEWFLDIFRGAAHSEESIVPLAHHDLDVVQACTTTRPAINHTIRILLRAAPKLPQPHRKAYTTMSSPSSRKRSASTSGIFPAPKRSHTTASDEMITNVADNDEESSISSVAMHSRAVAEFFPEVGQTHHSSTMDIL